jgi:hypothetical protein
MRTAFRRALLALIIGLGGMIPAEARDDYDALPDGEGKDLVYSVCSGCHSLKLVMQQGMTRVRWDKTLDWMYEKQGMARLQPEIEDQILDYLAKHYSVEKKNESQSATPSPFGSVRPLMPPQ